MRWLALVAAVAPAWAMAQAGSDIVVLGEVHDNPAHHANQARAVAAIKPAALVAVPTLVVPASFVSAART